MVYRYIADLHWYDVNSLYWREQLGLSLESYVEMSVDLWNSTCENNDITIVAGDIGTECRHTINALKELKGRKILVEGNHDVSWLRSSLLECFEHVVPCLQVGNVFVQHIPTQRDDDSYFFVHGHHHTYTAVGMEQARLDYLRDRTRFNCCADLNGHKPSTFLELRMNKENVRFPDNN